MFVEVNLGNREAVTCDFFCEGIFASEYENKHFDFSTVIFFLNIILNSLMKAAHIRPNDGQ
jgi:hypothetical protein